MKKRAVFLTIGITSYINSLIKFGNELKEEGIEVIFVVLDPCDKELIRANGFELFVFGKSEENEVEVKSKKSRFNIGLTTWRYHYEVMKQFRKDMQDEDSVSGFIAALKPDVFILPSEMTYSNVLLTKFNVPVVKLQFFPSPNRSAGTPLPSSLIMPKGKLSKILFNIEWIIYLQGNKVKNYAMRLLYLRQDYQTTMELLIEDSPLGKMDIDYQTWKNIGIKNTPELLLCPDAFDFPRRLQPGQKVVGPLVGINRKDTGTDEAFNNFLNQIENDDRPLIFAAFGTINNNDYKKFLKKLINAFSRRQDLILLLAIGKGLQLSELPHPLPDNVHVYNYVPQIKVLERASVMINHGGMGSVNECIYNEVPMLVVSGCKMDQNGNATRVQCHEIGRVSYRWLCSSKSIMKNIDQLLVNPLYKNNIREMKRKFIDLEKQKLATKYITNMIGR